MEILRVCALILFAVTPLSAQLVIEEIGSDSTRKTVTIGEEHREGSKSEWGAAFMSLAVPGLGQFYIENRVKGTVYLSTDLFLLAGAVFCEGTSRRDFRNSMNFARNYAGSGSGRDWEDNYWNDIALHDSTITSSSDWNTWMDQKRDFAGRYEGADSWSWQSMADKNSYAEQRSKARRIHSAALTFAGGMILNRVVSFIDTRASAGKYNSRLVQNISVAPSYSLETRTSSVTLTGAF